MSFTIKQLISICQKEPAYLTRQLTVGVTADGRRLDHTCVRSSGMICVGPANDNAEFAPLEALQLMQLLRNEPEKSYFRGPPKATGGKSRLKIVRWESISLAEFLGLSAA